MSIRKSIKQAQREAASKAVIEELEYNRDKLVRLDDILGTIYCFEAVLTSKGNDQLLVLPFHNQGSVHLEDELSQAVKSSLVGYRPQERETGDYMAFRVSQTKPLPKNLDFYVNGIKFNIAIVRENIDLDKSVHKKEEKISRSRKFDLLPESEFYFPPVEKGFEFVVTTDTASSKKYNLISLRTNVSSYFPGFKVPFDLLYDQDSIETWRVCASKDNPKIGENTGNYLSRGIGRLFRDHPELKANNLTFRVNDTSQKYEYEIIDYK